MYTTGIILLVVAIVLKFFIVIPQFLKIARETEPDTPWRETWRKVRLWDLKDVIWLVPMLIAVVLLILSE